MMELVWSVCQVVSVLEPIRGKGVQSFVPNLSLVYPWLPGHSSVRGSSGVPVEAVDIRCSCRSSSRLCLPKFLVASSIVLVEILVLVVDVVGAMEWLGWGSVIVGFVLGCLVEYWISCVGLGPLCLVFDAIWFVVDRDRCGRL